MPCPGKAVSWSVHGDSGHARSSHFLWASRVSTTKRECPQHPEVLEPEYATAAVKAPSMAPVILLAALGLSGQVLLVTRAVTTLCACPALGALQSQRLPPTKQPQEQLLHPGKSFGLLCPRSSGVPPVPTTLWP